MMISTICRSMKRGWQKLLVLAVWLLLWQWGSWSVGNGLLLVSPIDVMVKMGQLICTSSFWASIILSFSRILAGFLLALLVGALLAVATTWMNWLHVFIAPPLNVIKATPVVSFILLALLWVNSKYLSTFISFLMVLPIIYTGLRQGMHSIDAKLIEVGTVFGLPMQKMIRYIYLPSMIPYLASACTVGIGLSWKSGISAEVIGLPNHTMGMQLYNAKVYLNTPDLFAWTLTIILLSVAMEKLLLWLLRLAIGNGKNDDSVQA